MAAPASAAATAASAISFGVIGRYGDIDGVWMAPVTAQVMMTLRDALILVSPSSNLVPMLIRFGCSIRLGCTIRFGCPIPFGCLMPAQRKQAPIAPAHAGVALCRVRWIAERGGHLGSVGALPHGRRRGVRRETAEEFTIARAVVVDTARRIERNGGERPHERPAQAEAVAHSSVEVLGRYDALPDQPHGLGQQRPLQTVEHEAVALVVNRHRRLADR